MAEFSVPAPVQPLIWHGPLTSRSKWEQLTGKCPRAAYLSHHAGPTGYGLTLRSESLPLVTGSAFHDGAAHLLHIQRMSDALPTVADVRSVVTVVRQQYEHRCTERGYRGILAGPHTDEIILEQSALLSGLLWAFRLKFLPWLQETYRIVAIEEPHLHVLSCTCDAGLAAPWETHVAQKCYGFALQQRLDLVAQRRVGGGLAYFEFKTTGWDSEAWAEQWETKPQLGLGSLDAKARWGAEVTEIYIVSLSKGRRAKDRSEEHGRKRQLSPLCYGYLKEGNPPLAADEWLPAYEWIDASGQTRRASRAHRRTGIWGLTRSDWPVWLSYRQQEPEATPEEAWVMSLPDSVLGKVVGLLGPLNRQDQQLASIVRSMRAQEEDWQTALWALYEYQRDQGVGWADPGVQALLDRLIPQSWNCRPFGKEHQCEFTGICFKETGWEDPIGSGRYVPRRPHHSAELQQAVARGLLVADTQESEAPDAE